jgi:hypothetical protein
MTTMRFVGDVPLWLGLALALIVCVLSWRYYRRESFDLPRRLRVILPLLRSLAFFLGIMVLTGPVLHHRRTIGELGRVKIYLDASRSMMMNDRHMSTGRKLLIAEQLGWISEGHVDAKLMLTAAAVSDARLRFEPQLATTSAGASRTGASADSSATDASASAAAGTAPAELSTTAMADELAAIRTSVELWQADLKSAHAELQAPLSDELTSRLIQPLETTLAAADWTDQTLRPRLMELLAESVRFENNLRESFDAAVNETVKLGDESLKTALAMFDETPRLRRAELGLSQSSSNLLETLRQTHDVELLTLSGDSAVPVKLGKNSNNAGPTGSATTITDGQSSAGSESFVDVDRLSGVTDLSTGIVASQKSTNAVAETETKATPSGEARRTAVVLITDGQHNTGPSPLQTARILGSQGVSFYGVSIGASLQAADLAITGLEHPDLVFQKDTVRGVMVIADRMPQERPFVAQIRYADEVLWQQQLVSQNAGERRVEFSFPIEELVTKLGSQFASDLKQHTIPLAFQASITPLAEESETANNERSMRLAAIVQNNKVLILDGRSRWETRYLRNAFERDSQWTVTTIIAGPGTDDLVLRRGDTDGAFPATREALFAYDLVIFGELAPELLTDTEFEWLRDFVEVRGGGMVFVDGQRGTLRMLASKSMGTLLPVEWLPEKLEASPGSFQLTDKGATEPALVLAGDDQQNRRFWTSLPASRSLVPVNGLPGAEVLVEAHVGDRKYPAMVTQTVGAGRVLYMAFDETWRWRYKAADTWHQRIWNQLARHVMPRPFAVSDEYVSIDTGAVRYDFGDAVDVRVRLLNLEGRPALEASADALVWKDGSLVSTISLNADADVAGIYRGRIPALPEGEYEVSVRAAGYSDAVLKARSRFVVQPPESGEMTQTAANEPLLKQMAAASTGAFLREEDMGQLLELLAPLSSGRVIESDTLIWQSYWWFGAIVLLLTVEWILRKRAGLL